MSDQLDPRYDWVEIQSLGEPEPVLVRGSLKNPLTAESPCPDCGLGGGFHDPDIHADLS